MSFLLVRLSQGMSLTGRRHSFSECQATNSRGELRLSEMSLKDALPCLPDSGPLSPQMPLRAELHGGPRVGADTLTLASV